MAAKTSHKKRIYFLPVFIGIIPTHLLLSKVGEPPWSWIARIPIQVEKEKLNFRRRLFTSSIKCNNDKQFHVVVMQKRQRNSQKCMVHV